MWAQTGLVYFSLISVERYFGVEEGIWNSKQTWIQFSAQFGLVLWIQLVLFVSA